MAVDDAITPGDVAGNGELVDLSGVHSLTDTGVLARTAVLDIRDGQEDDLTLTTADLLRMVAGNNGTKTSRSGSKQMLSITFFWRMTG